MTVKKKNITKRNNKKRNHKKASARPELHPFWSGTISFGLINIPVQIFPANRSGGIHLRLLDKDGTPLKRRYYCPEHKQEIHPEHIVRGYEIEEGKFVVVRDEEFEALAPGKSRNIDLKQFVLIEEIPVMFFDRAYIMIPAGENNKAYQLLAEVMEDIGRAGIGTFVMRGSEYFVAVTAQHGILLAEILHFADEIRTPQSIALPKHARAADKDIDSLTHTLNRHLRDKFPADLLVDEAGDKIHKLIESKKHRKTELLHSPVPASDEDSDYEHNGFDLLESIRHSLKSRNGRYKSVRHNDRHKSVRHKRSSLNKLPKSNLVKLAKSRHAFRKDMNKKELIRAVQRA
jgi:DNA end-binding protein Ku